jgi:hypothetical protein
MVIKLTLGITFIIGAVFAFIATLSRQRKQVQFAYHEMHALTMLIYAAAILIFGNSIQEIIFFSYFLFIFYAFSEIIFGSWIFNLAKKIVFKILIIRILLGLMTGIATIVAMNYTDFTVEIFGVLFILVGINILLYVPVVKRTWFNNVTQSLPVENKSR